MSHMDKIIDRVIRFDFFRNMTTEKLHCLIHEASSNIEDTKNCVYNIIINNPYKHSGKEMEKDSIHKGNHFLQSGLAEILSVKRIDRFQVFGNTKPLKYYKDNFNNLITAALFQQDKISIPFCLDQDCTHPVYLDYIKKNHLQKLHRHISATEKKEEKLMFIPFFINGKLSEFIKLTGNKNMPMQVKIAEGTKGLFQIADMAIIDKHRESFSTESRYQYELRSSKLLEADRKMHHLVNSHPKNLNINIVANKELKSLAKIIVKDNEKFIKMFGRKSTRGTSSTIIESFYEQELINLDKKNLPPGEYKKISMMYKFVLAISALEVALTTIDSKIFLRIFISNKEINLKNQYKSFLLESVRTKLNELGIELTVYDENNLNIFTEKKVRVQTTREYIHEIRLYHELITKRLYIINDKIAKQFERYIVDKRLNLFPILDLDNLLGHGPIDGDDMLKELILNDPDKLHILLFELVPDAPHFWKKIYNCFNHLADASNTLIAFNETIFDVVVNNYLPSEKKGFHFDDTDEIIIIIDDDEQLQMLHIEEFIIFLKNCYENKKKVIYVSDNKGMEGYLKPVKTETYSNARFDKVNQYILDKVKVSTAKKPIILNFSETRLKHLGDKLHELLCTVGDYEGKSILFGYSTPSSLALMIMYNKYFKKKAEIKIKRTQPVTDISTPKL